MGESYSAAITRNAPRQAPELLRSRMLRGKRANEQLADWLHDYAALTARQATELERFLSKHVINEEELGTLAQPWQAVAGLVVEQVRLASDAAKRAQVEAERPLRDTKWPQAERALDLLSSSSHGSRPDTDAIDRIQELDEQRVEGVKTSLARFATVEVDRAQAQTRAAERVMQAWLAFDASDDTSAYVAQIVSGVAPTDGGASSHGSRYASSSSQASQQTVRRKSSILLGMKPGSSGQSSNNGHSSGSGGNSSGAGGLRSKVGSIFGRKKKNSRGIDSHSPTRGSSSPSRGRLTMPPDFGINKTPSVHSVQSSPQSSLRQSRVREQPEEEIYAPSPTLQQQQRQSSPRLADRPSVPALQTSPQRRGTASSIPPLTPTKAASPVKASSPTGHSPTMSNAGVNGSSDALHQDGSIGAPPHGAAPMPPPARSLARNPSSASVKRQSSLSRTPSQRERVGSAVFAGLPPAHDQSRDSVIDRLGPLPTIPATPQHLNSGTQPGAAPGSPDQFWTPAQRFPSQFPQQFQPLPPQHSGLPFEQANTSVASFSSLHAAQAARAVLPPLPPQQGLVASAVERVEAEYVGEELVRSSVQGEAVAQIVGPWTQPTAVLGVLLADPEAKLTPSPLLRQTSSLSFEIPAQQFSQQQSELVTYTAKSAVGRVPIKLTPLWRVEAKTVRLVLSYQLSDLYVSGDEVEVHDLVITVTITGTGRAHAAQSKPVATFSREKQRVSWRFPAPQTLRRGQPASKLLCQFVIDGGDVQPGAIELRARIPQVANSLLQLRTLSPQGEWVPVPTAVSNDIHSKQ